MVQFVVLPRHLRGGLEKNNEKPWSRYLASGFDPGAHPDTKQEFSSLANALPA